VSTDLPSVSVVVVAFNGGTQLRIAVDSILASQFVEVSVVVVDNCSTDGSIELLNGLPIEVRCMERNPGYGAAFNAALVGISSQWVVCANQDIVLEEEALRTLVASALEAERKFGSPIICAPRIVRPDGTTSETCHDLPTFFRQCLALILGERFGARDIVPTSGQGLGSMVCGWVSAVLILGRIDTFNRLDGFDGEFFMYVEDLDLFTRLRDLGGRCIWEPGARVIHFGGVDRATRGAVSAKMFALTLWNMHRYFDKHSQSNGHLKGLVILAAGIVGAVFRGLMWTAKALFSRSWSPGKFQNSEDIIGESFRSASGMARMFFGGAYWSAVALAIRRLPRSFEDFTGQTLSGR
jgi:N-acetylglucosaminyl-diphospho-decaprenol L-rhamnosyltransferase